MMVIIVIKLIARRLFCMFGLIKPTVCCVSARQQFRFELIIINIIIIINIDSGPAASRSITNKQQQSPIHQSVWAELGLVWSDRRLAPDTSCRSSVFSLSFFSPRPSSLIQKSSANE